MARKKTAAAPQNPIKHVVIFFQENHSTTNYFGSLLGETAKDLGRTITDPTDLPAAFPTHGIYSQDNHDFLAPRQHYTEDEIPIYYNWARRFTLCDRYFAEYNSPSSPNHNSMIAAVSPLDGNPHGRIMGWLQGQDRNLQPPYTLPTIPGLLSKQGVSWRNYGMGSFHDFTELEYTGNDRNADDFVKEASAGDLPQVSWVCAPDFELQEHTPGAVVPGQDWIAKQVQAIVDGGNWENTAIFLTWDEGGGFYDRVTPPTKETLRRDNRWIRFWLQRERQLRWGMRCPALVISPYAKAGYRPGEAGAPDKSHVSILNFIIDHFSIDTSSLTERQLLNLSQTDNMMDCFDIAQMPLAPPVTDLDEAKAALRAAKSPSAVGAPTTKNLKGVAQPSKVVKPATEAAKPRAHGPDGTLNLG